MSNNEQVPAWGRALIETQKELIGVVKGMASDHPTQGRRTQLEAALESADTGFKERTLRDFKRMTFKDEADFNTYLKEVESEITPRSSGGDEPLDKSIDVIIEHLFI